MEVEPGGLTTGDLCKRDRRWHHAGVGVWSCAGGLEEGDVRCAWHSAWLHSPPTGSVSAFHTRTEDLQRMSA